jgi:aryl carrier-like protein
LLIGGEGLAAGYHRRPELTKEKFVEWRGNRCYRTGDLAQLTREGKIDHLGRIDSQVKLHGHRIELEEIEAVLMEDTAVQRAAVVLREDQPGQPYLAGYLILRPGLTWDESETRRRLELRLPTYMQPTRLLTLDQFPLTPSGKLDRKGFPPPDFQRDSLRSEYTPPETPEERMLVELWSELLGVSPIGVNDNFFELGGNSIRAASMLQRLKKQWGWQLSSPRFFDSPTITGVIAHAVRSMSPSFIPRLAM